MSREIKYYHVEPVYAPDPKDPIGFSTAAMLDCMMTGVNLDTSGGGGMYLSKEAVEMIDSRRDYPRKARIVCDESDIQVLLDIARLHATTTEEKEVVGRLDQTVNSGRL